MMERKTKNLLFVLAMFGAVGLFGAKIFAAESGAKLPPPAGAVAQVFTETRENPIRPAFGMQEAWRAQAGKKHPSFAGQAKPGEFYVFQIGVQALEAIGPLGISFGDLKSDGGSIPASALRCLSLGGTNQDGRALAKTIMVPAGKLQALWLGVDVPLSAHGGYLGTAELKLTSSITLPVSIRLSAAGEPVMDHGDSVAKNLSRLRWLDSTVGSEPTVTAPFTPVQASNRTIKILGRELQLGEDGLPAQIVSHFSPANTRIEKTGRDVLASPMKFAVETKAGPAQWQNKFVSLERSDLEATWRATSRAEGLRLETSGRLDFTGSGQVTVRLTAESDVELADARLEAVFREDAAKYFMGLNKEGGRRPAEMDWKWDVTRRQDCFWLGDVNTGLMLRFKDAEYQRPLVNIYYSFHPLLLPKSWGNAGKGGVKVEAASAASVPVKAYSGARLLKKGESLNYVFELYLTPFRPLDTEKQWAVRFQHPTASHLPDVLDQAVANSDAKLGPNVINVHQATYYSPYINYPYSDDSFPAFCDLVKRAHARGTKVRVYYTTREITQNMPELFPLHSMNGEIIFTGPGKDARTLIHPDGPDPWLVANLGDNFIPAWVNRIGGKYAEKDLSVITTPDSRWNNFYLEGLKWLVDKSDLDGIYVDDTALDARSLQRARRILDTRAGRYIDLHSWNHFNGYAGYTNNLTIYMELLPYLDRLWLGEGFNASGVSPDFWLVEMSGLPFGLMSEMLDGANPWKGMLFGETARYGWSGDPRGMWKVWNEFGIQGTEFLPFFLTNCPVKTDNPEVLASVYRKPRRTFIALGSWAGTNVAVKLNLDWKALGLDAKRASIYAPAIAGMQAENIWKPDSEIPVVPGRGWFLVLDEVPRTVSVAADPAASFVEMFREGFTAPSLPAPWQVKKSGWNSPTVESSANALRINAAANVHAGIERPLPKGVRAVEVDLDTGTDKGQDWGAGFALIWPEGHAAKLNVRMEDKKFGVFADGEFKIVPSLIEKNQKLRLRILLTDEEVLFQQQVTSGTWEEVDRLPRASLKGDPATLRVGKLAKAGGWTDFSNPGLIGECSIQEVRVLGQ